MKGSVQRAVTLRQRSGGTTFSVRPRPGSPAGLFILPIDLD